MSGGLERTVLQRRAVVALALDAVALRADADERLGRDGAARRRVGWPGRPRTAAVLTTLTVAFISAWQDPAELGALAVVRADLVGLEPGVVDTPRDRVDLAAERRDPPAVDDVASRRPSV